MLMSFIGVNMQTTTNTVEKVKRWQQRLEEEEDPKSFADVPILVIDDDEDFADLLLVELRHIPGAKITVARDADEAVNMLTLHRYVLVVSDWSLNKKKTALDVLHAADPKIHGFSSALNPCEKMPVLFISGSEKVGAAQNFRSLMHFEPVSFILKRFGPPLISLLAENIVERFYAAEAVPSGQYQ